MGCGINDYVNKLTAELDKRKGSSPVAAAMLNELGKIGQSKIEEYEVSSAGDKRFSALYAKFKDGETIELKWAKAKGYKTIAEAKNKPALTKNFDYKTTYFNLWKEWSKENSKLIEDLRVKSEGKKLVDKFAKTENNQAAALTEILGQLNLLKNGKSESADKSDEIAKVNKLLSELGKTDANVIDSSKDSPKGKYSTLTKDEIPTELNKLVDGIKDENLKSEIGRWIRDKLKTMENC